MEILIGISLGLVISFLSVSFYALGISHGKQVKNGCTVKLDPLKAIVKPMKDHAEKKETEKKQDEFSKQVNELFAYDGRKKVVK